MRWSSIPALAVALVGLAACTPDSDPAAPYSPQYSAVEGARFGGSIYRVVRFAPPSPCSELGYPDVLELIHKRLYARHTAVIGSAAENRRVASMLRPDDACCITAPDHRYFLLAADGAWAEPESPASCLVDELEPVPVH
jgi:hypothetical protein